jgi:hypothetical protein
MNRNPRLIGAHTGAALIFLVAACTPTHVGAIPHENTPVQPVAGGCSGTVVNDSEPPLWAQGGWSHTAGAPWAVPWALGTQGDTIAYLFATQLVAGVSSPRADGSANKILWEARDYPSGESLVVEGRPLGESQPVVTVAGGPSIVDVPTPGCWTFRISWSLAGRHTSTINLEVLPAGMLP